MQWSYFNYNLRVFNIIVIVPQQLFSIHVSLLICFSMNDKITFKKSQRVELQVFLQPYLSLLPDQTNHRFLSILSSEFYKCISFSTDTARFKVLIQQHILTFLLSLTLPFLPCTPYNLAEEYPIPQIFPLFLNSLPLFIPNYLFVILLSYYSLPKSYLSFKILFKYIS